MLTYDEVDGFVNHPDVHLDGAYLGVGTWVMTPLRGSARARARTHLLRRRRCTNEKVEFGTPPSAFGETKHDGFWESRFIGERLNT